MHSHLPREWVEYLGASWVEDVLGRLDPIISGPEVLPPKAQRFRAFQLCPPDRVRAVILGQDPYHGPGQATGLAFAVAAGVPHPPSLKNILREWHSDLGFQPPIHADLSVWAARGVLLLNRVLTVHPGLAGSHRGFGWEALTEGVIRTLGASPEHRVFCLWGRDAHAVKPWIGAQHTLIESAHPSPLSAHRGFFGSRPFSRCNHALQIHGQLPLDWSLPCDLPHDLKGGIAQLF